MAGYPDNTKRNNVRRYLLTREGRKQSDNEVARQVGVSKVLVAGVRRQLIVAGLLPIPPRSKFLGSRKVYQPGGSARGGYVFDERGQVVQKTEWIERQASRVHRRTAAKVDKPAKAPNSPARRKVK